jgi:signal-transduction protein with cAMP-binding, CBS, and nucleotidyltransferase domain
MTLHTALVGGDVVTIGHKASVHDVAHRMEEEGVGCVVVVDDDDRAVGVVTDRDLTLRVVASGQDASHLAAENIMSQPLHSIDAGEPLEKAIACMTAHGVRRVPVLEEGRAARLVSLDDLLVHFASELADLGASVRGSFVESRAAARQIAAMEKLRSEIDTRVHALREGLEEWSGHAREKFLRELEGVRDWIKRGLQ